MKKWFYMLPFLLVAFIGPRIAEQDYLIWLISNSWWLVIMFLIGFSMFTHPEIWSKD